MSMSKWRQKANAMSEVAEQEDEIQKTSLGNFQGKSSSNQSPPLPYYEVDDDFPPPPQISDDGDDDLPPPPISDDGVAPEA